LFTDSRWRWNKGPPFHRFWSKHTTRGREDIGFLEPEGKKTEVKKRTCPGHLNLAQNEGGRTFAGLNTTTTVLALEPY